MISIVIKESEIDPKKMFNVNGVEYNKGFWILDYENSKAEDRNKILVSIKSMHPIGTAISRHLPISNYSKDGISGYTSFDELITDLTNLLFNEAGASSAIPTTKIITTVSTYAAIDKSGIFYLDTVDGTHDVGFYRRLEDGTIIYDGNIYNSNGKLTSNRTIDLNHKSLTFKGNDDMIYPTVEVISNNINGGQFRVTSKDVIGEFYASKFDIGMYEGSTDSTPLSFDVNTKVLAFGRIGTGAPQYRTDIRVLKRLQDYDGNIGTDGQMLFPKIVNSAVVGVEWRTPIDNSTEVIDNLTSIETDKALSANQGKILKDYIDAINNLLSSDDINLDELQEVVDFIKQNKEDLQNLGIANIAGLEAALQDLQTKTSINKDAITNLQNHKVNKVQSEDNAVVRFNGTNGEVQKSKVEINDKGTIIVGNSLNVPIMSNKLGIYLNAPTALEAGDIFHKFGNLYYYPGNNNGGLGKIGANGNDPLRSITGLSSDYENQIAGNLDLNALFDKTLYGYDSLIKTGYTYGQTLADKGGINTHPDMYGGALFTFMGSVGYSPQAQFYVDQKGQLFARGFGTYGDTKWKKYLYHTNKKYVYTDKTAKNITNTVSTLMTTPQYTIRKGKNIEIDISIPLRADTLSWGGAYINVNLQINGKWYNMGNGGYDGSVMSSNASVIATWTKKMVFKIIENLNITDDYTLVVELTGKSYNGTTKFNYSHDLNRTASGLDSRGALVSWGSDQNYATIYVSEIDADNID